mgnify:CR=1 FL=1
MVLFWSCQTDPSLEHLCAYIEREPCGSLKEDLGPLLRAKLSAWDQVEPLLRRLLHHPEEHVRVLAFQLSIERVSGGALIDFLTEALTAQLDHVQAPVLDFQLSHAGRKSSDEVETDSVYGHTAELLTQLRDRLTAGHKETVRWLARSPHALLRGRRTRHGARSPRRARRTAAACWRPDGEIRMAPRGAIPQPGVIRRVAAHGSPEHHHLLPHPVVYRKKSGMGVPLNHWFRREPLRSYTRDVLLSSHARGRGYFDMRFVERLVAGKAPHTMVGRDRTGELLWMLLAIELWHRVFVDGEGRP